jgi:hypothetical protein
MSKITLPRLKRIIQEEIEHVLNEGENHDAASKIMSAATKLISAIEAFKESSTGSASAAVSPHIDGLESALKQIVSSPMNYVDSPKPVVKKVSLRPTGKVM